MRLSATASFTWDIGSTGTLVEATTTVNVPGVKTGDIVMVQPNTPATGFQYSGYVSAASVVTLRAVNATTGTVDPASITGTVLVLRPTT
jgi:hypothetical protein